MDTRASDHPHRTLVASFLFVDLVEFSCKSVAEQLTAKAAFSRLLIDSLRDLPPSSHVVKDTGDGALIAFMSDPEHALYIAQALADGCRRGSAPMLREGDLRMGIHLGSVKAALDVETRPNFIGDGINAARRIVDFALPGQITASRSYVDAVSRLEPEYEGLFVTAEPRQDKHGRVHELFVLKADTQLFERLQHAWRAPVAEGDAPDPGDRGPIGRSAGVAAGAQAAVAAPDAKTRRRILVGALLVACVAIAAGVFQVYSTLVVVSRDRPALAPPASSAVAPAAASQGVPASGVAERGAATPALPIAQPQSAPSMPAAMATGADPPPTPGPAAVVAPTASVSPAPTVPLGAMPIGVNPPKVAAPPAAREPWRVPASPRDFHSDSTRRGSETIAPSTGRPSPRCNLILQKASVGESLSDNERKELAESCR